MVKLVRYYDGDEPQWRDTRTGEKIREEVTVPGRRMPESEWQERRESARRRRRRNQEQLEKDLDRIERVKKAYYEDFGRHPKEDGLDFQEAAGMVDTTSNSDE